MSGDPLEHDETDPGVAIEGSTTDRPDAAAPEKTSADVETADVETTGERDSAAKMDGEEQPAHDPVDPDTTLHGESSEPPAEHTHSEEEAPTAVTIGAEQDASPPTDEAVAEEDPTENLGRDDADESFLHELDATVNLTGDLDATVNLTGDLLGLGGRDDAAVAHEVTRGHLKGLLEALIFASDKPIKTGELAKAAAAPSKEVRGLLEELRTDYSPRGMQLDEVAGGWIFRTNAAYAPFVRDLTRQKPVRLSRAQIETLAILAYRQPVTRPEIDEIRGVDCGPVLKLLLERELVRMLGRKDEPGRPVIYGTTVQFLELFGLKSLKDLPTLREFTDLNEESRRTVERELGETMAETVAVTGDGPRIPLPSDTLPPGGDGAMNTERPPAMPEEPADHDGLEPTADDAHHANAGDVEEATEAEPVEPDDDAHAPLDDETKTDDLPRDEEPKTKTGEELSAEEEFPDDDDDDFDDDDEDDEDEEEDEEEGEAEEDAS